MKNCLVKGGGSGQFLKLCPSVVYKTMLIPRFCFQTEKKIYIHVFALSIAARVSMPTLELELVVFGCSTKMGEQSHRSIFLFNNTM